MIKTPRQKESSKRLSVHSNFRQARAATVLIVGLVVAAVALFIGWYAWGTFAPAGTADPSLAVAVERGRFTHEITAQGSVESENNIEVKCKVKSSSGSVTILSLIPEGTYVEKGDILCELDKSKLEQELVQQQIVCNSSRASKVQAEADHETAILAKEEYEEGTFPQQEFEIDNRRLAAEEAEKRAQQRLTYNKELLARGYVTSLQVEAEDFSWQQAQREAEIAKLELKVLRDYTYTKMITQLDSDIAAAAARLDSETKSHELDNEKLELIKEQITNCTVRAPAAGQIVYQQRQHWRGSTEILIEEGATVRENQVLFKLPDPAQMQVDCRVNETHVSMVRPGMPARIRVDALPDVVFRGQVTGVNEYPEPGSFMSSSIKEYKTFVSIENVQARLRPGLTAEVRILVNELDDVLLAPVQCVFEHGQKTYCIEYDVDSENWRAIEVQVGATNDKQIVIESGVTEGMRLVQGASRFRDRVDLPELTNEQADPAAESAERRGDGPPTRGGNPPAGPSSAGPPGGGAQRPAGAPSGSGGRPPGSGSGGAGQGGGASRSGGAP